MGACTSLDSRGDCDNFTPFERKDLTVSSGARDKLRNLSGYVKAGLNFGSGQVLEGLAPFSRMEQAGALVSVPNPSFEYKNSDGSPLGWKTGNTISVATPTVRVMADALEIQKRATYVPEGQAFAETVNTSYIETSFLEIIGAGPYIVSGYLNTEALSKGEAYVEVHQYNAALDELNPAARYVVATRAAGLPWRFQVNNFALLNDTRYIKIRLGAWEALAGSSANQASGSAYFDNIRVEPALQTKFDATAQPYVPKTCRLYPQDDSPSCEYQDSSGARQRGMYGYCLEYDPENPALCLTWWPVDIIPGEMTGELKRSYTGKAPVYYCAESEVWIKKPISTFLAGRGDRPTDAHNQPTINQQGWWPVSQCGSNFCVPELGTDHPTPVGYSCTMPSCPNPGNSCLLYCTPQGTLRYTNAGFGWYLYEGTPIQQFNAPDFAGEEVKAVCTKLVQTVKPDGTNFAWLNHLQGGYQVPDLGYTLKYDSQPYGSITIPAVGSSADPGTWGLNFPLMVEVPGSLARAGAPYACANINPSSVCVSQIKVYSPDLPGGQSSYPPAGAGQTSDFALGRLRLLFTRSFGGWAWDTAQKKYASSPALDWSPPNSLCPGNVRPPDGYCLVAPIVANAKINDKTSGAVQVAGSGFINLKFNSLIDPEQLPLTSYFVDWGDGQITSITGVEMQNRPHPENPHSMYHFVSYWDLLSRSLTTPALCPGDRSVCYIIPKIQLRDKWGVCNGPDAAHGFWATYCTLNNTQAWTGNITIEVRKE